MKNHHGGAAGIGSRRKGIGTTIIIVVVVIVIMIGTVAFVTLPSPSASTDRTSMRSSGSGSSPTSSSTGRTTESNTTVSSASGLELRVSLNTTVIGSGGAIASEITLFNSLDENLTLIPSYPANSTLADWNGYDSFSGGTPMISMVGYALFRGHYSTGNISDAGDPLRLAPSVDTDEISYSIPSTVVFLPDSDLATLYLPGSAGGITESITTVASNLSCVNTSETYECRGDGGLSGYWNTSALLTMQRASLGSGYFHRFSPGEYTLAVEDVWNQTVYAHFQVMPTTGTTPTTSSSSALSVPPPTTTVTDYGCTVLGQSSSGTSSSSDTTSGAMSSALEDSSAAVVVDTSAGYIELDVDLGPSVPIESAACSYVFTNTTTPVACGVMCGGGIGKTEQYSYVWKLNFSLSSADSAAGQNLTISQASGMNSVFPQQSNQVSLNSQAVTWYSSPACLGGDGVEGDCMTPNATSITIEIPASIGNGAFQLVVSSSAYLVP